MEEIYIFQGKEFTRTQLEEKYGDRVDEVIQNYGFQKKNSQEQPFSPLEEQAMSVASSEPSETISEGTSLTIAEPVGVTDDVEGGDLTQVSFSDKLGSIWNSTVDGLSSFSDNIRQSTGIAKGSDIEEFTETYKETYPDLYKAYQEKLKEDPDRSYFAAQAAFMSLPKERQFQLGEKIETFQREGAKERGREAIGVDVAPEAEEAYGKTFFGQAFMGTGRSIPAMVAASPTMGMSFFDMAYQDADETIKIVQENSGIDIPKRDEEIYKLTIAATTAALEKIGLSGILKGTAMTKNIANRFGARAFERITKEGKQNITKETFDRIINEEKNAAIKYAERVATGMLSEGETGTLQQLAQDATEQGFNAIKGKEIFDDKTAGQIAYDALYAGALEATGAAPISSTVNLAVRTKPNTEDKKKFVELVEGLGDIEEVGRILETEVSDGKRPKGEAQRAYAKIKEYKESLGKVPSDLSLDDKVEAVELISERTSLEKEMASKDDSFKGRYESKINDINQRLSELGSQETTETQEEVAEEAPEEVAEEVVEEQVADTDSENILDAREKFNTVSERASRNEPINENEIDEAINEAYDALSELEGKDSQEAQIMQELIEDEIQKLEQYDNKTTTETRKIAEERTVRTVKKTPRKTVPSREKDFVGKKAVVADNKGGGVRGLVEIVETPDGREYYIVRSEGDTKTEVVGAKTDGKKTTRRVAKVNGFGEAFVLGETSKVFSEATVNFDKDGNPVSVTFPVGKDGKQVTVKSPEIAAEFELEQMKQQEYDEQVFEETFIEFTGEEQVEVRKPTPPRQTQEETDAVQERSTEEVDVRQQAEDGKEVGERDTKEQEPTQESKKKDKVISALDKAIEATSGKGKAMDATLGIPMFVANSALRVVKQAYLGGKSLSEAIVKGYNYIDKNGFGIYLGIDTGLDNWQNYVLDKFKDSFGRDVLLAPNGMPSRLNKELYDLVRTPEFKRWFGDWENDPENASKVVDDNGEPQVVFHGSNVVEIDSFDRSSSGRVSSGLKEFGSYFSTNESLAELYANQSNSNESYKQYIREKIDDLSKILYQVRNNRDFDRLSNQIDFLYGVLSGKGRVYPLFLNVRDLIVFDANEELNIEAWNNLKADAGYKTAIGRDAMEVYAGKNSRVKDKQLKDGIKAENTIEMSIGTILSAKAYKDTDAYKNAKDKYLGDAYLVFDHVKNYAKLADGSNKTFDLESNSISDDNILSALDKAINATSGKGKAMDATLAIPLSLANSALKIVKAAYIGGKSLAQAIKDGYDHITQNGGQVRASDWEEFVNEKIFEGEKKNTRETIDQNSSSLEQVFPFLQNFNPKHDYSQAQLNDINAFIDRYLEDGNDFASGKVEAIIEGVNGAYKEDNGKAGTRSLNNVDKWFSNVDQMFAAIFNRARNTYNVMVNSGYRGNKGLVEEKGKIDALKNDWISRFKAVYENLSVSDKSLLSEMKVMIAAYMEQAVNMNNQAKENEQLQESEVIERIREDFVHTIKEVRNNGDNDQRAEAADEALKIFNNVTSLEEALAILTKGQRDYLNALIEANNTFLDEKVKRARENGKRFSPLDRYIHIAIRGKKRKSTDPQPEDFADEIMESSSAIQIVSSFEFLPFSGGESGSKESGATKTRVLNRKPLADGEYYDLNFLTSQFRSFNNSNLAIFTYHSIIKMNAFFSQEGVVKKLFGGGNVGSQNISQIKNQVDFELNSDQIQAKANQDLYGKINYAAALGGAKKVAITATMFRILQPFKQSAVFMNTLFHAMIMNGGKGLIRAGTSASYILSDYVSNRRGEDSGSDITSAPYWGVMKKAPEAFRDLMESLDFIDNFDFQGAKKARDFYNRAFNASAKYTLTAWDRGVAQISFLILYEQSMRKQGLMKNVDVSSSEKYMEWWEEQSQNPNEVAIAEASSLVSKDQNASRPFQRSKLQTDESGAEKWVRTLGFPFMTFLTSKTNSLYQDGRIITTREKGKVTKEERKDASLRYAGTLAEVALFHGIGVWGGYYVRNFLASASELLFEGDDEEDKFKKDDWGKEASLWKKWWTNSVTDGIPFVNMAQPAKTAVAYGYNYSFWSLMNKTSEDFQEKYPTFDIFNGSDAAPAKAINFDKKWYDNLGYVGIAYANVQNAAILWYEGTQGEGFDAYGNKVFYTEDQADNLKLNAFLTTVGVFPLMLNADANFGSMYERMDAQRYSFDSKLARDLDAYVDDKDKALSVQEYLVEKAEELEQERGIMGLAGLARQMEYDLSEFTDRRILQTIFAVAQGKKSASEGKINEFLYNLSRRKSLPSRAVANQIKTRLDKLPEEEAKQLEKEFMIAGIDLFGENKWVEIIDIIDEYNKK